MRVPITYIASSGHKYNLISDGIRHAKAFGGTSHRPLNCNTAHVWPTSPKIPACMTQN